MLETIREYGIELVRERGEEEADARHRHASWFLALAEQAVPYLTSVDRGVWLHRLEADHPNLRAALSWSIDSEPPARGQRLVAALWRFWETNGHVTEGRVWTGRALAQDDPAPGAARAGALTAASILAHRQGDFARSIAHGDEALALWRTLGDRAGIAYALNVYGNIAINRGDFARAVALHGEALAIRRELGDLPAIGTSLNNLGIATTELGDYERAWTIHQEQLALERKRNDPVDIAFALAGLGTVAHRRGDLAQAAALHGEALSLRRQVDPRGYAVGSSLDGLGLVLADLDEPAQAAELLQEGLALRVKQEERPGIAKSLDGLAGVAASHGSPELATRLLGAADALRESIGIPRTAFDLARRERALAAAARAIGAEGVTAALASGRATPLAEVVDEASRFAPATLEPAPSPASARDFGLSAREIDVLRLLVEGRSDREIGSALFISHRTVMIHVSNILAKFGVTTRTAAVTFAHTHRLDLS
jgi:ATP/maltotriose-dependent transcriptional regulator MalT